jgi:hypothetical protein
MGESRTPRTAIFDPLCAYLEAVHVSHKADALFVFVRLYSSEITGVAATIAAIDSLWKRNLYVFGNGTGVSLQGYSR